jgi:hypothetical protein
VSLVVGELHQHEFVAVLARKGKQELQIKYRILGSV